MAKRKLQCSLVRYQVSYYAESGGRLVCAEAVGYVRSSSANEQYASKLLDLLEYLHRIFRELTEATNIYGSDDVSKHRLTPYCKFSC